MEYIDFGVIELWNRVGNKFKDGLSSNMIIEVCRCYYDETRNVICSTCVNKDCRLNQLAIVVLEGV